MTKVKMWIIGGVLLALMLGGMYFNLRITKEQLEKTKIELQHSNTNLEYANTQLDRITKQNQQTAKDIKRLEEIKNEAFKNDTVDYRDTVSPILSDTTRMLIRQARTN